VKSKKKSQNIWWFQKKAVLLHPQAKTEAGEIPAQTRCCVSLKSCLSHFLCEPLGHYVTGVYPREGTDNTTGMTIPRSAAGDKSEDDPLP